jgi:chromosome segregation and condensation protein ScpB
MEISEVRQILEVLLLVSERHLSLKELKGLIKTDYADTDNIENILNELKEKFVLKLSPPALEPINSSITRAGIDEVRGVESSQAVSTLFLIGS